MKANWGLEALLHAYLTSALDGGEWSASRPGRLYPLDRKFGGPQKLDIYQFIFSVDHQWI
jgi:hypothetical protein